MKTLNGSDIIRDYKVYLPTDKRSKASIRGFWKSERGLCYDYIRQTRIVEKVAEAQLPHLKKRHRQEALFYTRRGKAYIWYNPNKVEELSHWEYFAHPRQTRGLKSFLKDLLQTYGGFTVYIKEDRYLVEVWV